MAKSNILNFFDLALAIVFTEIEGIKVALNVSTKLSKAQKQLQLSRLTQIQRWLPTLKGPKEAITKATKQLADLLKVEANRAFVEILADPKKFANKLGQLTAAERKTLGEDIASATGEVDSSSLHSSWLVFGVFEPIAAGAGNLTLTTKQGKSYLYPSVPIGVWEAMKAAQGSNGSGAGSVFWTLYLRGARVSPSQQSIALAFRLSRT